MSRRWPSNGGSLRNGVPDPRIDARFAGQRRRLIDRRRGDAGADDGLGGGSVGQPGAELVELRCRGGGRHQDRDALLVRDGQTLRRSRSRS